MEKESAIKKICKLERVVKRQFDKLSGSTGVNGAEGRVIHFLILNQDKDIYQKDVEIGFDLRPSTASELLKKMESKGYITRETSKTDARLKKIILTDLARQHEDRIFEEIGNLEHYAEKDIDPRDLEAFDRVTESILRNLRDFKN
ncbi:MarR family winged helix-turn-helix transcriptional regulator [Lachnospira sp.]|jgi:DNA-binding MarR family transcriptional regulator|uniref:MarR family winged helix-turn-helix transcriptional regulator n=1 Tax=Lachnospira sp. TaxID=2049031 RepID=UPI00257F4F4E|nr:MarR family transcriptional regulator [Lachnospira sp.]